MFFLKKYIYLIPPIMLLASFSSNFITFNFVVMGNILGYSILTNLVFIYVFRHNCWFTKLSVYGLIAMNVLGVTGNYIHYDLYGFIYEVFIMAVVLFLGIVLTVNKV